jgi:hypothetical protein
MNTGRTTMLLIMVVLLCLPVFAQEYPRGEVAIDYSFARFNPNIFNSQSRNLNGGGGEFTLNLFKGVGIKADLQGYGSSTTGFFIPARVTPAGVIIPAGTFTATGNLFSYMFGPQFKVNLHRVAPFAEALWGGAYSNVYANLFTAARGIGAQPTKNAFAQAYGAGIDIRVSHSVAIRAAQLDYFMTRFSNAFVTSNQNNWRYQAGVVFGFGGAK